MEVIVAVIVTIQANYCLLYKYTPATTPCHNITDERQAIIVERERGSEV